MQDTEGRDAHLVVIVGAGPAGLYGARKLAEAGHEVVIINRDLKPGGLAEYGIYFNKHRMKEGIRQQFRKILADPRVRYVGNVRVSEQGDLTLAELCAALNPSAIVIAAGAQGTKFLGLPGEHAPGVYHAKDLVYHYNHLPPFSQQEFIIGERVAVIGIGNVMVDIAHWLVHEKKVAEVIAVARRGPAERAYTDQEIKSVAHNIDRDDLKSELERIRPRLEAVGQNVETIYWDLVRHWDVLAKEGDSPTRLEFRFLSAPVEILHGANGRPRALKVEDTALVRKGDGLSAKGLGTFSEIEVDTVIFAVGDSVDLTLGLPCGGTNYATCPTPDPEFPGDEAYKVHDPATGEVKQGMFVIGWSRQASDGLVGKARQDGERGMQVVNRYLARMTPGSAAGLEEKLAALRATLAERGVRTVDYKDVQRLEEVERKEAEQRGLEFFKFAANEEMFARLP
jgi:ferredoxin/flavodoxin---NADP+ reductase